MQQRPSTHARPGVGRSALLVAAALLGLLLIHGVGSHALHGTQTEAVAHVGHAVAAGAHAGHALVTDGPWAHPGDSGDAAYPCEDCVLQAAGTSSASLSSADPGIAGALFALCLAVLTALALLLLGPRGQGLSVLQVARPARVPRRHPYALRIHAPPDLHALSVLRC